MVVVDKRGFEKGLGDEEEEVRTELTIVAINHVLELL